METQNSQLKSLNKKSEYKIGHRKDWKFIFRHPLVSVRYGPGGMGSGLKKSPEVYDHYAENWVERLVFNKLFQRVQIAFTELSQKKGEISILDLHCGTGHFARKWLLPYLAYAHKSDIRVSYTGVDKNPDFVRYAADNLPSNIGSIKTEFLVNHTASNILGMKYDIVIAASAYHHAKDYFKIETLRNIARLAKPDAPIILTEKFIAPASTSKEREAAAISFYKERIRSIYGKERNLLDNSQKFALKNELYLSAVRKGEYKTHIAKFNNDCVSAGLWISHCEKIWPVEKKVFSDPRVGDFVVELNPWSRDAIRLASW